MKKEIAFIGVFLALALVCSYVESLIPFYFGVPGMKLGLTNIVIIIILYCMGTKESYCLSVLRVILAGFLFGNMFSILYSMAGAMLSLTVMYFMKKTGKLKIVTISTVGGICHNIGQLIVASFVVENYHVFYYMPVLLIAGFITGLLIGIAAQEIILRLRQFF